MFSLLRRKGPTTDWQAAVSKQYSQWLEVNGPGRFVCGDKKIQGLFTLVPTNDSQEKQLQQLVEGQADFEVATVAQAKGDYLVFLQPSVELWSDALARFRYCLGSRPDALLAYFDTEILERSRGRKVPYFKPDYSPDLLLSSPYWLSPLVIKRSLYSELEVLSDAHPAFLWDMALKAVEKTNAVAHFPTIVATLTVPRLGLGGIHGVGSLWVRQERSVIAQALKRRGLNARVEPSAVSGAYRVIYAPTGKLVSIIISTKDRADLLARCVNGILRNNDYQNWELIIVNNNSEKPETFSYFDELRKNSKIRILDYPKPFNIAAIFNMAAEAANGEYLCFMGNDTEPISHDWLSRMTGYMQRPEIGVVGAKLLYPTGTIQHAGVVLGYGSAADNSDRVAGHPYSQFPIHPGYFGVIELQRNCSAVTGAVTLTRRDAYLKVGGYDAKRLRMLFNDVDFCLKMRKAGYFVVYAPEVILYHHERASLGEVNVNFHIDPNEIRYMRDTWHHWEDNDPFYNPNLTLDKQDYSLRVPPRQLNF